MSSYGDFLDYLRYRESTYNPAAIKPGGGYIGHYQIGEAALVQIGYIKSDGKVYNNSYSSYKWQPVSGVKSTAEFLATPEAQQKAIIAYHKEVWRQLEVKGADKFIGGSLGNGIPITKTTLIAAAHLKGADAVAKWLKGDRKNSLVDGNKVDILKYMKAVANYDVGNFETSDGGKFNLYFKVPDGMGKQVGMSKIGSSKFADKSSYTAEQLDVMARKALKLPLNQPEAPAKNSIADYRAGAKSAKTNKVDTKKTTDETTKKVEDSKPAVKNDNKTASNNTIDEFRAGAKANQKSADANDNQTTIATNKPPIVTIYPSGRKVAIKNDNSVASKNSLDTEQSNNSTISKLTIDAARKGGKTNEPTAIKGSFNSELVSDTLAKAFNNLAPIKKDTDASKLPTLSNMLSSSNNLDVLLNGSGTNKNVSSLSEFSKTNVSTAEALLLQKLWQLADQS